MQFAEAQKDMNLAYFGGATGVLVSGFVWLIAGLVGIVWSPQASILALFFGGMSIFPLGMVLAKLLKRSGKHQQQNPLGKLALESTAILFVGLFLAFCVAQIQLNWFYPIMLLAIGVRYLVFNTLYGLRVYWVLGVVLMFTGAICMLLNASFLVGVFTGGITEILFAGILYSQAKKLEC